MHVSIGEYNGNKMIVIKKDEHQEYAAFQGGMRKFIPIVQAMAENTEEVLALMDSIGGEQGQKVANLFRDKFGIKTAAKAQQPAPSKKKQKATA